jgi:hypothetical protein
MAAFFLAIALLAGGALLVAAAYGPSKIVNTETSSLPAPAPD